MTAAPQASHEDRFQALPAEQVNEAFRDDPESEEFRRAQSRDGEELRGIGVADQLRAIYTSPFFWSFCAAVFPNNDVLSERREGAPQHYPDWFLFLLTCVAGVSGIGTMKNAVTQFRSTKAWADFVADIDAFVPDDMTRLADLPCRKPGKKPRLIAVAGTASRTTATAYARRRAAATAKTPTPLTGPPAPHHLDYFLTRWRGQTKATKDTPSEPFPITHPYYGIRAKAFHEFRRAGIDQAQVMGILLPGSPFVYDRPDRNQYVGADGVVMPLRKGTGDRTPSADLHETGVGRVYGSKFTVFSARVNGQYKSRLIFDFVHTHKTHDNSQRSESDAVLDVMPALQALAEGGIHGLLVDSAVRGKAVTALHRQGIRVVNYPHAHSNPDGKDKRLSPKRVEKSKLRHIATHINDLGHTCEHPVFAVGGEFMELVMTADGSDAARALDVLGYEHRDSGGVHRERINLRIPNCPFGDGFDVKVPLFHDNPVSTAPRGQNWGEVVRLYPPGSWQFKFLYGARNDTEARHADLKARVKHLPHDVLGQELRLLGAAMAHNALAWQVHLQANHQPNVFDDTA